MKSIAQMTKTKKSRILVVDDDEMNRDLFSLILEKNNFDVDTAQSGEIALEKAGVSLPDLVLLDIEMDGMNGFEVCRRLKEETKTCDIPVIFISGVLEASKKLKAFDVGGVDFVSKPFQSREVLARIHTHLKIVKLQTNLKQKTKDLNRQIQAIKALETKSREAEKKTKAMIEFLPIGIGITTFDGKILSANSQILKIFGFSSFEEMSQHSMGTLYHEKKDRDRFLAKIKKGRMDNFEAPFKRADGQVIWCSVSSVTQKDAENQTFFLNSIQDITERKKIEKEKSNLLVQLTQADKMASIGQLAAGVAHEINNPLSFVSSNLNSLEGYLSDINHLLNLNNKLLSSIQDAKVPDVISQKKDMIQSFSREIEIDFIRNDIDNLMRDCSDGLDRIKKIVVDLKDFAHPETTTPVPVDINAGIKSTLNVAANELKYKAIITTDLGDIPPVMAVPQQINQVFLNILVNAAQTMTEKGEIGKITIKTWHSAGHNFITISDTGCGISRENLKKIFDPFFTTKEIGKGTGLGMNIAYNIIKGHKGSITVESELSQGTTFKIALPAIN
jgi:two-component system NtrC family sensor kinase